MQAGRTGVQPAVRSGGKVRFGQDGRQGFALRRKTTLQLHIVEMDESLRDIYSAAHETVDGIMCFLNEQQVEVPRRTKKSTKDK